MYQLCCVSLISLTIIQTGVFVSSETTIHQNNREQKRVSVSHCLHDFISAEYALASQVAHLHAWCWQEMWQYDILDSLVSQCSKIQWSTKNPLISLPLTWFITSFCLRPALTELHNGCFVEKSILRWKKRFSSSCAFMSLIWVSVTFKKNTVVIAIFVNQWM